MRHPEPPSKTSVQLSSAAIDLLILFLLLALAGVSFVPPQGLPWVPQAVTLRRATLLVFAFGFALPALTKQRFKQAFFTRLQQRLSKSRALRALRTTRQELTRWVTTRPHAVWSTWLVLALGLCAMSILRVSTFGLDLLIAGAYQQLVTGASASLARSAGIPFPTPEVRLLADLAPFIPGVAWLPLLATLSRLATVASWFYAAMHVPQANPESRARLLVPLTLIVIGFEPLWRVEALGYFDGTLAAAAASWAVVLALTENALPSTPRRALIVGLGLLAGLARPTWWVAIALFWLLHGVESALKLKRISPRAERVWSFGLALLGLAALTYLTPLGPWPLRWPESIGKAALVAGVGVFASAVGYCALFPLALPFLSKLSRRDSGLKLSAAWLLPALPFWVELGLDLSSELPPEASAQVVLWQVLVFWMPVTLLGIARQRTVGLPWIWALAVLLSWSSAPVAEVRAMIRRLPEARALRSAVEGLPRDLSVTTERSMGPWLASDRRVSVWPDLKPFDQGCPELVVIRHTESGSLNDYAVQSIFHRCRTLGVAGARSQRKVGLVAAPPPVWRVGDWAAYKIVKAEPMAEAPAVNDSPKPAQKHSTPRAKRVPPKGRAASSRK